MMRCVLYVRVSKNDGDQEPETQLRQLRDWAQARGWRIVAELQDRVTGDPVRRGRNPAGLVSALNLIHCKKAEVLAVWSSDRLVRSPWHLLELVAQVQAAGGRVASLQDGADLDTTTDTGELFLFLRGWWSRMELKLIRQRTNAGLARARAEGRQLGRPRMTLPDLEQLAELMLANRRKPLPLRKLAALLGTSIHGVQLAQAELADRRFAPAVELLSKKRSCKTAPTSLGAEAPKTDV